MDAEKFDKVVLDLLYDELDELTRASAIRHTEQSGRAKALYSELRATREVGVLPLVEPPEDLEARILAAEELARAARPLRQRLGTFVTVVASYAMRPQIGMAAVLLLMVGSSLLLLRVKPGEPSSVQVTERGVPESDKEPTGGVVLPQPASPLRADPPTEAARPAPRAKTEAPRDLGDDKAPASDLGRAAEVAPFAQPPPPEAAPSLEELGGAEKSAKRRSLDTDSLPAGGGGTDEPAQTKGKDDESGSGSTGCAAALPRYEAILSHPPSVAAAHAALFAAGDCYAELGRTDRARRSYSSLLNVPDYAERARRALASLPSANATAAHAGAASPAGAASSP